MIVDSQCHVSPVWYEPVESLIDQMDRNTVARAVLIQMIGQTDNGYQQDCLRRFPRRFASVVWVDPQHADAVAQVRALAAEGATGLRLRPTARSPGPDPLAIWRAAEACGMAISCVGNSAAFATAEFSELVAALPGSTIVLEHLGGTSQPDADAAARATRLRVLDLARHVNVYLKMPGLGELIGRRSPLPASGSPFAAEVPSIVSAAVARFGAGRIMWGSDFPPVCSREGYSNALRHCQSAMTQLSRTEQEDIFGEVARRVFKLAPTTRGRSRVDDR